MGRDEEKAYQMLQKNREIHKPLIKQFKGKWLKEMGDGVLARFNSASDAVYCACAIQLEANAAGIPLRIGIHQGEVVLEGGDIIGDGVNIASRIEASAEVGRIHISDSVFHDLKNKKGIRCEPVGETKFKNVDRPVPVYKVSCDDSMIAEADSQYAREIMKSNRRFIYYILSVVALILSGLFIWRFMPYLQSDQAEKSIAVIPFINDSDEAGTEYFANGVMEEIINHLQRISDVEKVPGRRSVEQFRNSDMTIPEIGEILDVTYIVEGSVQKFGDRVKVVVQVLKAEEDHHILAESYNYEYQDQIGIMAEIAEDIARKIRVKITPAEKELIEKIPTTNLTAYDFYLRGQDEHMKYWRDYPSGDRKLLVKAEDLYRRALEYDSTFARAYAGLGHVYWNKSGMLNVYFRDDALDTMLMYAEKALSYDDQLADAYYIRSMYYDIDLQDYDKALKDLNRALSINPNYSFAYVFRGYTHIKTGYYLEAIQDFYKGIEVDQSFYKTEIIEKLVQAYNLCGLLDMSRRYAREQLKLQGNDTTLGPGFINRLNRIQGNYEACVEFTEKGYARNPSNINFVSNLLEFHNILGNKEEAYRYALEAIELNKKWNQVPAHPADQIGYALWQQGKEEEARFYFEGQIERSEKTINLRLRSGGLFAIERPGHYSLAEIYALLGEKEKAYNYLSEYANQRSFPLYNVVQIKKDPFFNDIREEKKFQKIVAEIEAKYQREHNRVKTWLEETGR